MLLLCRAAVIFLLFCCNSSLFAQEKYTIKGKIISPLKKEQLSAIPVVLLKWNENATPPMFPIARSQTNEQGEYIFENIIAEDKAKYLIGALIQDTRISSQPVQLSSQKIQTINIEFSGVQKTENNNLSFDLSAIRYTNRLLIFHILEGFIRITEIIQLQNISNKIVSSKEQPLQINLPEQHQNFTSFQVKQETLKSEVQGNKAFLSFEVPPAQSELYFEYDIPFTKEMSYLHPPFPQTGVPLNILFDKRYLEVVALGQFLSFDKQGRYTIGSFSSPPQDAITINVRSKIIQSKVFLWFAGCFLLLACCSLGGFFWNWYKQKIIK